VATGSLGQGLSVGVGMALALKNIVNKSQILPRIFVLLGDSELAEGQNWEAMQIASYYKLNNLIGILDVNRLGQRGETMLGWDISTYQKRIESFGWKTIVIEDGHDLKLIANSYQQLANSTLPTMIIAKTIKGKGCSIWENKDGWHSKPLSQEQLSQALNEIGEIDWTVKGTIEKPPTIMSLREGNKVTDEAISTACLPARQGLPRPFGARNDKQFSLQTYLQNTECSTKEAYGKTLVELGKQDKTFIVIDGEVSNSTHTDLFQKEFPDRFYEMFIAEQNMVSTALGFSIMNITPFVSAFGAFLTRAFDQIRMAQYSFFPTTPNKNLIIAGSYVGVSTGMDGPSGMALEDIAMMRSIRESTVLYPSDAVSTAKLTSLLIRQPGISYLRLTREKTPIIYNEREEFKIGGCKIHFCHSHEGGNPDKNYIIGNDRLDPRLHGDDKQNNIKYSAVIIAAGITLHEALKAQIQLAKQGIEVIVVDLYSIKPVDEKTILELVQQTGHVIVVEDHYPAGGIGEAILAVLINDKSFIANSQFSHLCVRKLPNSGKPEELLRYEEIDAEAIIKNVSTHLS